MAAQASRKRDFERVAEIISDAGGEVVGRTRLQKIAYLLEAAGFGSGFAFEYRHYGPFSEDLASAARRAKLLGVLNEVERATTWGGLYSIYSVGAATNAQSTRTQLARIAAQADPIELELAATAAFLATEGASDPWGETAKRKPEKASVSRLAGAKSLYQKLSRLDTPKPLPAIA
jgi:uncharacterized protein YwgA